MIKTLTYNQIDPQQWQALVDRSPYATWFQTQEAYEFYAAVPNEMKPFAVGVAELEVKGTENSAAETTASTPYTLHHTLYTLHSTPYTLHPTLYTLHPTLYTLHPTLYTLHPTLYTKKHKYLHN